MDEWSGYKARIVIDPLTPVMWSVERKYEQRDLVSFLLRETRKIGTVICTLEEHGVMGDLAGPELVIPMYLADNVIHLRYRSHESPERRELKIIKCRSSRHSHFWHPYSIIRGSGLIIRDSPLATETPKKQIDLRQQLDKMLATIPSEKRKNLTPQVSQSIQRTIEILSNENIAGIDPKYLLTQLLSEYDLLDDDLQI